MIFLSKLFGSYSELLILFGIGALIITNYLVPSLYKIPVQVILVALIGATFYFSGVNHAEEKWRLKVAEAETKIAVLESKAPEITTKVITKYVDKIKYIDRVKEVPVTKFVTVENDKACIINKGFVNVYNAAIKNDVPVESAQDQLPSSVQLSDVASNQQVNMVQYHKVVAQLEALQEWVREQEKAWKEFQQSSR